VRRGAIRDWMDRTFGNAGWDPHAYSQWTRYLVIRPLVIGLTAGVVVVLAMAFAVGSGASDVVTVAVMIASVVFGYALGGWIWSWLEVRRERAR
jgi:hypothetical protein